MIKNESSRCCKVGTFKCQVTVPLPDNIDVEKQNRSVSCDRCIVDVIKHLWSRNIQTLGCCCGHGRKNPDLVISSSYSATDILAILLTISQVDDRDWDILQWQLVRVG